MFDFNTLPNHKKFLRKVQLGSGKNDSNEYINMDMIEDKSVDIVHNLLTPLPFENNSIEVFFSNHVLEHIAIKDIDFVFNEIYRCLKSNGKFISVLPDFEAAALQFIAGKNLYNATGSIWGCATLGWTPPESHIHMYGWTKNSIKNKLLEHNFIINKLEQIGTEITVLSFEAKKE